jgi:hypothetical protein
MPLNATTSLPLPRTDPEAMGTTGDSEATALPDRATAAHATQASLSIQRMAILRRAPNCSPRLQSLSCAFLIHARPNPFRLIGYVNNLATHRIEPDAERAQNVAKLFEWYASGEYWLKALTQKAAAAETG